MLERATSCPGTESDAHLGLGGADDSAQLDRLAPAALQSPGGLSAMLLRMVTPPGPRGGALRAAPARPARSRAPSSPAAAPAQFKNQNCAARRPLPASSIYRLKNSGRGSQQNGGGGGGLSTCSVSEASSPRAIMWTPVAGAGRQLGGGGGRHLRLRLLIAPFSHPGLCGRASRPCRCARAPAATGRK